MDAFILKLLSKMTLKEKIGQLNLVTAGDSVPTGAVVSSGVNDKIRKGQVGGLFGTIESKAVKKIQEVAVNESRLGIPLLFGGDVIHGHKTIFPIPLGLSCSWDMDLIEKTASIASAEAAADGLNWVFSPMVDIARDPRWGRCAESSGEDPYLGAEIAAAMVRGYQQDDLSKNDTVMACVKHMALYGAAEGGRDYNTTDMSRRRMFETYFPPYKSAIDAGVGSVMTSFNEIDGIPATGNKWLLTNVLRENWAFKGVVVSDYTSVNEMIQHGMGDLKTVSALALNAGLDMDMVGEGFLTTLEQSLKENTVSEEAVNTACRHVLEAKYKLGLFDDPYRYCNHDKAEKIILSSEHRAFARKAVADSCVLLKNKNDILPLDKNAKIALVGPLANDKRNMLGTWSVFGDWQEAVSIYDGIKNVAAETDVFYARGANITNDPVLAAKLNVFGEKVDIDARDTNEMIEEALGAVNKADVIVAVVGEAQEMSGEAASRSDIGIPTDQQPLLDALAKTGKPLVIIVLSGRPLALEWENDNADALLAVWFGGTEAGKGIADILFGDVNPSAKLTMCFPRSVGQIPVYYAHKNTGRPFSGDFKDGDVISKFTSRYLDIPNDPLFPFGYGLGYSRFEYGDIQSNKTELQGDEDVLEISLTVKNIGRHDGREIVQLYISDPMASIARPVKELKKFQKIDLDAGCGKDVSFRIGVEDLKFYNNELEHIWEPGEFIIHIGPNALETRAVKIIWK